jgi:outer membrane receptor protein involved in Fe transport
MWEHRFSPVLSIDNALRYDDFMLSRTGPNAVTDLYTNADFDRSVVGWSANTALIDKVTDDDSLRLAFGRGLKLPSLDQLGEIQQVVPRPYPGNVYGDPALMPLVVYDYQAGWDHRLTSLDATARVDLFHQMTMKHVGVWLDFIDQLPNEVNDMTAGSMANGVELDVRHKAAKGWTWGANYTFERLHQHTDLGLTDALPVHKVNANLGYAWGAWEADLYGSYASSITGRLVDAAFPGALISQQAPAAETLSPRLSWRATDSLTFDLVGSALWPYRDAVAQRTEASYILSVRYRY